MIDVLVDALAAYRLTRLARTDTITLRWRDKIEARSVVVVPGPTVMTTAIVTNEGERYDEREYGLHSQSTVKDVQPYAFMREMLDCGWCTSVWATGVTLVLPRWVRRALAVAAVAGIVSQYLEDRPYDEVDL